MVRTFRIIKSFNERLLDRAQELRDRAKLLAYGPERDEVLKKARQIEIAAHMDDWLNSPGLRAPKKDDTPGPRCFVRWRRQQGHLQ